MERWQWLGIVVLGLTGLVALVMLLRGLRGVRAEQVQHGVKPAKADAWARRMARRLGILVGGTVVVLAGLLLSVPGIPGPGFLIIIVGLAILATEFVWARRWLRVAKNKAEWAADRVSGVGKEGQEPSRLRRWLMKIKIPGEDK